MFFPAKLPPEWGYYRVYKITKKMIAKKLLSKGLNKRPQSQKLLKNPLKNGKMACFGLFGVLIG